MTEAPAPGPAGERIVALDFVRGVAVLGILVANVIAFGQPHLAYSWPGGFVTPHGAVSDALWLGQFVLVDGKMRGLFTLLFGAGLALLAERGRGCPLQLRRLAWLFVFGLLHFFLLWRGDILTLYALCGLIALPLLGLRTHQLLALGVTLYLGGAIFWALQDWQNWAAAETALGHREPYAEIAQTGARWLAEARAHALVEIAIGTRGSYGDFLAHGWHAHRWDWWDQFTHAGWEALPLILIGMGLYRARLFDSRRGVPGVAWLALGLGTAVTALIGVWALRSGPGYFTAQFAAHGLMPFARLPVVVALAAVLAAAAHGAVASAPGRRVAAAGRMAFSNYIGSSLVMLLVFQPWGLGLYGRLERPALYLVVALTWLLMLGWSQPWLARFRHGPLEWLWRCLTYRRRLPFVR